MFYKGVCKQLKRSQPTFQFLKQLTDIKLRLLTPTCSYHCSRTVDIISEQNPLVNTISKPFRIDWREASKSSDILKIMQEYTIPKVFNEKHFFSDQIQLYKAIMRITREQQMSPGLFDVFASLHQSGSQNLSKIKASSMYTNDFVFNSFCLALFKGDLFLNQKGCPPARKVHRNIHFMHALLLDKLPVCSFCSEIMPHLDIGELRDCCRILIKHGFPELMMRIVSSSPSTCLTEKDKAILMEEFLPLINPTDLSYIGNIQTLFTFSLGKIGEDRERSKKRCSSIIGVFFGYINSLPNISIKFNRIHTFLVHIQKSGIQVTKDQIFTLEKTLKIIASGEKAQLLIGLKLIEQIGLLSCLESERAEIHEYLNQARRKLLTVLTMNPDIGTRELSVPQITELSTDLQTLQTPSEIQRHASFKILQDALKESVRVTDSLNILTWLARKNKLAARMLMTDDLSKLIEQNVEFLSQPSFSQIIFLKQQRVLEIPLTTIAARIEKDHSEFSSILLVQSYYILVSVKEKTTEDLRLLNTLIWHIFSKEESLKYEDAALLLKSVQFVKDQAEILRLQDFLEALLKKRVHRDTRYVNMYFIIVYHKIMKGGLQSSYANSQIEQIEAIISSPTFDLSATDTLHFAQLIIALTKFYRSAAIIEAFIKRVQLQRTQPRFDQIVEIYIALLKICYPIRTPLQLELIGRYEKMIQQYNRSKSQIKNQHTLPLFQVVKVMHALVSIYSILDQERQRFLASLYEMTLSQYSISEDLSLSLWLLWQQSLVSTDINSFLTLFSIVERNVDTILQYLSNSEPTRTGLKPKQFNKDLKTQVTDVTIIQLFQATQFFEINDSLKDQNPEFSRKFKQIRESMEKSVFIQEYQPGLTVRHTSNSENDIRQYIEKQIAQNFPNLTVEYEHKLEGICFIDFFIRELNLTIECNGAQHYVDGEQLFHEQRKLKFLNSKGYKTETIRSSQWIHLDANQKNELIHSIFDKHANKK